VNTNHHQQQQGNIKVDFSVPTEGEVSTTSQRHEAGWFSWNWDFAQTALLCDGGSGSLL